MQKTLSYNHFRSGITSQVMDFAHFRELKFEFNCKKAHWFYRKWGGVMVPKS